MLDPLDVLDQAQLKRIESVHRGFLYQHLYAVRCLFRAQASKISTVVVEADEDVELLGKKQQTYLQIKTRAESLIRSDIEGALERFSQLRMLHDSGKRSGQPVFAIVSNVAPGKHLLSDMKSADWPPDVNLYWPENPPSAPLPSPSKDAASALVDCIAEASALPLAALQPETLIFKLAGLVSAASAGVEPRQDHKFETHELPAVFEQLVLQLQELPTPPARYRAQQDEPALNDEKPVRVISGFSGAGKTAWVAQAAVHSSDDLAYFDIGDIPSAAIATPLARELAARFFGNSGGLGEILLPGATGFEMLLALDRKLDAQGKRVLVIIDNAHRASAEDLSSIINRMPHVHFTLLCQPGETVHALETVRGLAPQSLAGWTADTVAEEAQSNGVAVSAKAAQRTIQLTAGLPLYVQSAIRIAKSDYGADLERCIHDIEELTASAHTAQEIILKRVFGSLSAGTRHMAAFLSVSDIPLSRAEVLSFVSEAGGVDEKALALAIKELRLAGAVELFGSDRIKIHDAVRLLGREFFNALGEEKRSSALNALRKVVLQSILTKRDLQKLSLFLRILGEMGDLKSLIQFATDEVFHEFGIIGEVVDVLANGAASHTVDPAQRFGALDALVFYDLRKGDTRAAANHLAVMKELLGASGIDETDQANFENKTMLLASQLGDKALVDQQIEKLRKMFPNDAMRKRIMRYNIAYAHFKLGRFEECLKETEDLIPEYYKKLRLTPGDVMGRNPDKLFELLDKKKDHTDDIKHLADTLDLQAQALNGSGRLSAFARIHAMKFYAMIEAVESIVRVGQDLADEFIGRNDYDGARQVLETNVLPYVIRYRMTSYIVHVRSQYAVVLAYCGKHDAADAEMARLAPYEAAASPEGKDELIAQRALIASLRRERPPPQWQMPELLKPLQAIVPKKMRRNEPCYCGSGVKFKRCHGKNV